MTAAVRCLVALLALQLAPLASAEDGDGTPDGKKSYGGSGHLIQLNLPDDNRTLAGLEIHGSRYGTPAPPAEKFLIYVMNADRSRVTAVEMAPYSLFERGEERWVAIPFENPLEIPAGGWIAIDFRAGRTKGVYVSYDAHPGAKHSMSGLPGLDAKEVEFEGDWMIRPLALK